MRQILPNHLSWNSQLDLKACSKAQMIPSLEKVENLGCLGRVERLLNIVKLFSRNSFRVTTEGIFRLSKGRHVEYMSTWATLFFGVGGTFTLRLVYLKGQWLNRTHAKHKTHANPSDASGLLANVNLYSCYIWSL